MVGLDGKRAPDDAYYKKTIELALQGRRLRLKVAQELFSSHDVDAGTRLLLRTLAGPEHLSRLRVLDLGCGYGPIGLALKALDSRRLVHMVDRDALAVEYSRQNADLNGLSGVFVLPGLDYEAIGSARFDLVASNVPAKVGERALERFLLGAREHLEPGGIVAVVVVAALAPAAAELLEGRAEVVLRRSTAAHTALHYTFPADARTVTPESSLHVYERGRMTLRWPPLEFEMLTAYSLPEFDSLSFASELAAQALLALGQRRRVASVVVLHPGQGHLAVLAWKLFKPLQLRIVDRDLLALEYTRENLRRNGCPPERAGAFHQALVEGGEAAGAHLVLSLLPEKGSAEVAARELAAVGRHVSEGAWLIAAGTSTAVTRCLALLERKGARPTIVGRRRSRGHSAVTLRPAAA